jgi:MoaA/NifB/PqqE/SkfB family radical SAM enzyme
MTAKVNTFTSTGNKLLRHGNLIDQWSKGIAVPQSLQVAPTEHCTLKCKFCSVANRSKKYVFDFEKLKGATFKFILLGTKTVEITGGGDPLCYKQLNEYLEYLIGHKMQIGIITNGIGINKLISKDLLNSIDWIRISSNVLDYKDHIELPKGYTGTLGFSYCWTEGFSTKEQLVKIRDIARDNDVKYVRLVPNCLATKPEQERNNIYLGMLAEEVGEPFFFQRKNFDTPPKCYWGYMKPFLYCDEYIYPCSSTVLNPDADKQFNSSYRWCHYSKIEEVWRESAIESAVDTKRCSHCVFADQNRMLEYAFSKQKHEDFI